MLSRKFIFAAAVVLLSATFNQARAQFQPGDFITYTQAAWGDPLHQGGMTLAAHYDLVYFPAFGLVEVGLPGAAGFSIIFTGSGPVLNYLPSSGPAAPLNADLVDPTSSASGIFGGEVLAMRFNIDFADAEHTLGSLDIPFGDLVIHSYSEIPQVNGLTVRQVLGEANTLLGGGSVGYGVAAANQFVFDLNRSFLSGESIQFAQDHLRISGDFNGDFTVDAADYVVWRKNSGSPMEYNEWRTNFGLTTAGGGGASSVPEPSAVVLLAAGGLASLLFRRRKSIAHDRS